MKFRHLLFEGLLSGVLCVSGLRAQRMTSVSVAPGVIVPVHTAKNHLTVLDLDNPIEDVAAEHTGFDIQWRGHTVFVLPKDATQSTSLFVWTKNGRVVYELLPPSTTIQNMDVTVDTHFRSHASAVKAASAPANARNPFPSDLFVRAQPVEYAKKPKHGSHLLISDVYRCQDSLFLLYEVRNNGPANLRVDGPPVVTAASVSHISANTPVQLSPGKAARIKTGAPLPLIAERSSGSSLAPGQSGRGVIGVHIPPVTTPLAIRVAVSSKPAPLQAMVLVP
ncbi:MAG: hypothetical protein ACRD4O_15710 [Bryobacteraceae bacterium]